MGVEGLSTFGDHLSIPRTSSPLPPPLGNKSPVRSKPWAHTERVSNWRAGRNHKRQRDPRNCLLKNTPNSTDQCPISADSHEGKQREDGAPVRPPSSAPRRGDTQRRKDSPQRIESFWWGEEESGGHRIANHDKWVGILFYPDWGFELHETSYIATYWREVVRSVRNVVSPQNAHLKFYLNIFRG